MQDTKDLSSIPEVGLVLMDEALRILAWDRGAAAILNLANNATGGVDGTCSLPAALLETIHSRRRAGVPYPKVQFLTAVGEYGCRFYVIDSQNSALSKQSILAFHLERVSVGEVAIEHASAKYHLSVREAETLKGVLLGMSTKEVAEQMNISPNTVKAYIRLIMIKLGVSTRWGIIAKFMGSRASRDEGPPSSSTKAQSVTTEH